tara:strand:+ start:345 stop:767 length:423 start_codon:yes stop_codon:yes gene_type:complete
MLLNGQINNNICSANIRVSLSNTNNKISYMNMTSSYLVLILAVILGVTSNTFAKSAQGFTVIFPSIITAITIVLCMYTLSIVMKNIPVGVTYASFAGLTIIATVVVGIYRFNQIPDLYTIIGLGFIIIGVLMVNLLGSSS